MSATNDLPPPGVVIQTQKVNPLTGEFSFGDSSPEIMPPITKTAWSNNNGLNLEVTNVVLIDSSVSIDASDVAIYWNNSLLLPIFYIDYSAPSDSTNNYVAYEISFSIPYPNSDYIPPRVETILWDEDPRGSRGTVTGVQPPAG